VPWLYNNQPEPRPLSRPFFLKKKIIFYSFRIFSAKVKKGKQKERFRSISDSPCSTCVSTTICCCSAIWFSLRVPERTFGHRASFFAISTLLFAQNNYGY
jgi:hypothetical protein